MTDLGDKVPASEKTIIDAAIKDLKSVIDGEDADAIKAKTDTLMQASMKLGEMAYRQSQEEQAGQPDNAQPQAPQDAGSTDDVVDADFTDLSLEDDDKKD